ncbi:unnamed protein product [Gadus morhua 'NCC']
MGLEQGSMLQPAMDVGLQEEYERRNREGARWSSRADPVGSADLFRGAGNKIATLHSTWASSHTKAQLNHVRNGSMLRVTTKPLWR